jgi:nitroimidazol reductase NimA-like FMN-containing flavoprotein (pyridoxamine 5'-phosphate oxidase superfamily)
MLGQLDEVEIEELLASQKIGRLGCHSQGRTYVVPIAYAYEDGAIVAHSTEGLKLQMMRDNPYVCFEIDAMDDISNWRSVVAWGRFEELHGATADRAMAQLIARLAPLGASPASTHSPKDLKHQYRAQTQGLATVVYRIVLTEKTGRFERS